VRREDDPVFELAFPGSENFHKPVANGGGIGERFRSLEFSSPSEYFQDRICAALVAMNVRHAEDHVISRGLPEGNQVAAFPLANGELSLGDFLDVRLG
jgi:hypothetical protein